MRWAVAAILAFGAGLASGIEPSAEAPGRRHAYRFTQEEAIAQALAYNAELAQTALAVRRRALALEDARHTVRGVQLRPSGAAVGGDGEAVWDAGFRAEQPLPWGGTAAVGLSARQISLRSLPDQRELRMAIELTQPLFRGFGRDVRQAPVEEADERLRTERRRWSLQQAELVVDVVRLYEDIQMALRQIEADEAFLVRLETLRVLAAAREGQSRGGRLDALKLDLQRGEAELRLHTNRDRLDVLRVELCERLGLDLDAHVELTPAPIPDVPGIDVREAVAVAFGWRLDYAQALENIRTSHRRLSLVRRDLQPDLTLRARFERGDEGRRWSEAAAFGTDTWRVGLGWDMDVHRKAAWISVESAELDLQIQQRRLELERVRITREVHTRLLAHRRAKAEEEMAFRNRNLARDRAELARALYRAGRGDIVTVTDAEDALVYADLAWLSQRRAASVSAYAFLQSLGTLVEPPEDLRPDENDME